MSKLNIDLALSASWIVPVVPEGRILEDCTLIINDGQIIDIVPRKTADQKYQAKHSQHLDQQVLIPGLINAHGHAAMSLLRGYADDTPLMTWLEEHIWPAESQWVDEHFVRDGTEIAVAEMLLSGTTCFSDMYFFPEAAAMVAHQSGIRAQLAFPVMDFPTAWGSGPEEYLHKGLALHDKYRSHERIKIAFGPHAPYTVSDEPLKKIATYAEELQIPVQIHLHESAFEVESAVAEKGQRPIQRMAELGLLSPLCQCVHMTQLNAEDIELVAQSGAHVIHCPDSNLKLSSGLSPITELLKQNINVAIGTDGAASNNDLNMLSELKQTALLAKFESGKADSVSAQEALHMATLGGAKALGIDALTGSLEIGKAADICAIDLSSIRHQPVYNPISQIVYSDTSGSVSHVWVHGKALVEDQNLTTLSMPKLLEKARYWKDKIQNV